ncbi:uncharacterized protein [Palaemon carinicauda]|uniref:uncharacterized protein n=1 Tax=Palaemon carinicauda TaxID=392227 RepID=UPI0035B5E6A3
MYGLTILGRYGCWLFSSARPASKTQHGLYIFADIHLEATNEYAIPTHSYESLTLLFGSTEYNCEFLVANVTLPILSVDIFSHFKLLFDAVLSQLVNSDLYFSTPLPSTLCALALHISKPMEAYAHLLILHLEVSHSQLRQTSTLPINTGTQVFAIFRHLGPDHKAASRQKYASSPWSSALHIVLKKHDSLHPCGDYRDLNMQTEPDHYPIPIIANMIFFYIAKVYSKLNLLEWYYQLPMNLEVIPKSAITTAFGTYSQPSFFAVVRLQI